MAEGTREGRYDGVEEGGEDEVVFPGSIGAGNVGTWESVGISVGRGVGEGVFFLLFLSLFLLLGRSSSSSFLVADEDATSSSGGRRRWRCFMVSNSRE